MHFYIKFNLRNLVLDCVSCVSLINKMNSFITFSDSALNIIVAFTELRQQNICMRKLFLLEKIEKYDLKFIIIILCYKIKRNNYSNYFNN